MSKLVKCMKCGHKMVLIKWMKPYWICSNGTCNFELDDEDVKKIAARSGKGFEVYPKGYSKFVFASGTKSTRKMFRNPKAFPAGVSHEK